MSLFLTMSFVVLTGSAFAQFKVAGNGNVGINTTLPAYKLDINSIELISYYSGRNALHINHNGLDPRICSNDRIVFYKLDGTGFAKIEGQSFLQHSDRESKENITSLDNRGIETILKLKGFSFNSKNDPNKRKEIGFLAQEVEPVIPEAVFTTDSTKSKSLAYNSIIPYLVEAIKEQQVQIECMTSKVVLLEVILTKDNLISSSQNVNKTNEFTTGMAWLEQNIPNPFSSETRISCFIPSSANSSFLYIYTANGSQLRSYTISGKGNQVVTIDRNSLDPGMYFYTLVVDNKIADTKKMILTKE